MIDDKNDKEWTQRAEQNLWELANGAEGMAEKLDKEGCVHELRYKLPPNIEANKFILKNRSGGKWADKTEVSHTNVNVNLTASYNEVRELMSKQRLSLANNKDEVIEAEVVRGDSNG